MGFLDEVSAGSWPDWFAAIGTSSAFLVAGVSYRRDVKRRRESQARLVYANVLHHVDHVPGDAFPILAHDARIGGGNAAVQYVHRGPGDSDYIALEPLSALTVAVHNGSDELIWPARVRAFELRRPPHDFVVSAGPVEPHSEYVVELLCRNVHHPGSPSLGVTVIFRDSSGRWWKRSQWEPIERVHDDPESAYTREQQQQAHLTALALGLIDQLPEPKAEKVPFRLRWHRLMRRMRGKDPIP